MGRTYDVANMLLEGYVCMYILVSVDSGLEINQ